MNVVVTGGAGFVGAALVRRLLADKCCVVVVDDMSGGRAENLPDHPGLTIQVVRVGADNAAFVDRLIANADLVYHLASPIGVVLAHCARYEVVDNILDSGTTVIRSCRKHKKPLVLTSSSEVYGRGLDRPIRETDPITVDSDARWGYATAKAALEHMVLALFHDHGIPSWVVRPFNIAGARQRPQTGLVVASFIAAAVLGRPLEVHGDGSQTRSFLHVEDCADALAAIAFNSHLAGQVVNIGGESAISIADLAEQVRRVLELDVPIAQLPMDKVMNGRFTPALTRIPDIGRIRLATGWRPVRSLDDSIRECRDIYIAEPWRLEGLAAAERPVAVPCPS